MAELKHPCLKCRNWYLCEPYGGTCWKKRLYMKNPLAVSIAIWAGSVAAAVIWWLAGKGGV